MRPITKNQLAYLSKNLFVPYEVLREMGFDKASDAIDRHKQIYRETSDVTLRQRAVQKLSEEFYIPKPAESGGKCTLCHKPREPYNQPDTCSC